MKQLIFIFGLTIYISASGQQLTYKGDLVDTIKITSNLSYYHFDEKGTTTGSYYEYIIVFNNTKEKYILDLYQKTKYKITYKSHTFKKKERILKQEIEVDKIHISNLLHQFEINYIKPTFDNIGITNDDFQKLTDKKHIIQVAKWHKTDWHFKKAYSTKEQNEIIFKGCQNIDTFNLYLSTAFDTTGYVMVTDFNDHFDVKITTKQGNYRFEGKYPNSYKQPWYNLSDKYSLSSPSILNFSINSALVAMLPENFSRLGTIKFEALTNEYIEWYLNRRGIIF
ncbi:MAG: hypothetical protein H6Q25_712 [Bacteroidetes bacterium]|nr:hypothetical protein [Bacteroidota bacterium]